MKKKTKIFKIVGLSLASFISLVIALLLGAFALPFGALSFSPTRIIATGTYTDFKQISKECISLSLYGKPYLFDIDKVQSDVYVAIINQEDIALEARDLRWDITSLPTMQDHSPFPPVSMTLKKADSFSFSDTMNARAEHLLIAITLGFIAWSFGKLLIVAIKKMKSIIREKD